MILFVHGFGSCGWGSKSLQLRRYFGVDQLLAPDLPPHPRRAVAHVRDLLQRYPIRALIGSSLGGFFATSINRDRHVPTVLINPVVHPHRLLADHTGWQRRWCDDRPFLVDADYLDALRALDRERLSAEEAYLVLLQRGDEVLDYRDAARFYRDKDVVEIAGGSHRFDDLSQQLPRIAAWLTQHGQG